MKELAPNALQVHNKFHLFKSYLTLLIILEKIN
jgi:hypothetical protein